MERRIERALLHPEQLVRGVLDVGRDGVAVELSAAGEALENEEREGALEDVVATGERT
jgi:hypothetical protein